MATTWGQAHNYQAQGYQETGSTEVNSFSPRSGPRSMSKRFDARFYRRFYMNPRTRVTTREAMARRAVMVAALV